MPQTAIVVIDYASRRLLRTEGGEAALRWLLPPGSTVKPFVIAALLDSHKLDAAEPYFCSGILTLAGRSFNCSHPRQTAPFTARTALAYSCNAFAAHFAARFSPSELARKLAAAGFQASAAPSGLLALGDTGILVTAVDLARAYAGLAGSAPEPVIAGLEDAVAYGTARLAGPNRATIAGKTGTGTRHAWFAGFAPSRSPKVVVSVLTAGKSGGADAAPIAGQIFRELC